MQLFLTTSVIFLASVFIFLPFILSFEKNSKAASPSLPPGKLGWPLIGETLSYLSSGQKDAYRRFFGDRMQKYSALVFRTSLFGEKMAVLCGPSGNKVAFLNEDKLLTSWFPSSFTKIVPALGTSGTPEFKRFRRAITDILSPKELFKYVPIISEVMEQNFVMDWNPNSKVKVYPLSKKLTVSLSFQLFIGVDDPECIHRLTNHFSDVITGLCSVPINFPGTSFYRAIKAANAARNELCVIIKRRISQLSEGRDIDKRNFLSQLLHEGNEDGVFPPEVEIADKVLATLVASHDTTSSLFASVVYYLAEHPHVYNQVLKEQMEILKAMNGNKLLQWEDMQKMKYSRNVLNEILRIVPPAPGSFREAITDFTYAGYTIPKGWKVFWSVYTTHMNPEYFPNPEKFDPSRFEKHEHGLFTFTPFGGGNRICPGAEFSRLVVLVFIHGLVTKFRWEKLYPDEKITCIPLPVPEKGLPIWLLPHGN